MGAESHTLDAPGEVGGFDTFEDTSIEFNHIQAHFIIRLNLQVFRVHVDQMQ